MAAPRQLELITVAEAVERYVAWLRLRTARGAMSEATRDAYQRDAAEFATLVGPHRVLDEVEGEDIELALAQLASAPDRRYTRGQKPAAAGQPAVGRGLHARARWLAAVRSLFGWALDNGHLHADPTRAVTGVRVPHRASGARLGLSVEQTLALLRTPPALPSTKADTVRADQRLALRDEVVLRLLAETGPRVAEICAADREDVRLHPETGTWVLRIRFAKGGRQREVPLSPTLVAAVEAYQERERPAVPAQLPEAVRADAERALLVSVRGRRLGARDIQRLVARHVRYMPPHLRRQVTPHGLRHTAATVLLRYSGADVATVADILGHADVGATSVYLDESATAAASALARSPLAGGDVSGPGFQDG